MEDIRELIPIEEKNGQQAVNARHLYAWLEVKKDFSDWIKMQFQRCDLSENVDYQSLPQKGEQNGRGGHNKIEYALSIEAAKEISMMSQTEKGKRARRYFIECERIANQKVQSQLPTNYKEALVQLLAQVEQNEHLQLENKRQAEKIEEDAPKVVFADAIVGSQSNCLIGELAKIITQNGYKIGQNRLFEWLRNHHFLGTKGEYYNIPNQEYVERGLFVIKKTSHSENGVMKTTSTPTVTPKGQMYFVNAFLKNDLTLFERELVLQNNKPE